MEGRSSSNLSITPSVTITPTSGPVMNLKTKNVSWELHASSNVKFILSTFSSHQSIWTTRFPSHQRLQSPSARTIRCLVNHRVSRTTKRRLKSRPQLSSRYASNWRRRFFKFHHQSLHRQRCTSSRIRATASLFTCWDWSMLSTTWLKIRRQHHNLSSRSGVLSARSILRRFGRWRRTSEVDLMLVSLMITEQF